VSLLHYDGDGTRQAEKRAEAPSGRELRRKHDPSTETSISASVRINVRRRDKEGAWRALRGVGQGEAPPARSSLGSPTPTEVNIANRRHVLWLPAPHRTSAAPMARAANVRMHPMLVPVLPQPSLMRIEYY